MYKAYFEGDATTLRDTRVPALDLAVALTSTNYNTRGMQQQAEKLLVDYVLAAVAR